MSGMFFDIRVLSYRGFKRASLCCCISQASDVVKNAIPISEKNPLRKILFSTNE